MLPEAMPGWSAATKWSYYHEEDCSCVRCADGACDRQRCLRGAHQPALRRCKSQYGFLNLRTGPNTQSRIVVPVKNGTSVVFDEVVNGWVHVYNVPSMDEYGNVQSWMSKSSLKNITTCD